MAVTQRLMRHGSWELALRPDTPTSVTDPLRISQSTYAAFGTLFVTPSWVDLRVVDPDDIVQQACYSGVYRRNVNRLGMEGAGLSSWLGDEDGKGYPSHYNRTGGTFSQWLTDIAAAIYHPGWTAFVVGTVGGTLTWDSADDVNNLEALRYVCRYFGCEWLMGYDGTIYAGAAGDLFGTDLAAVFHVDAPSGGAALGIPVLQGEASHVADVEDYVHQVTAYRSQADQATVARVNYAWRSPWNSVSASQWITRRIPASGTGTTALSLATAWLVFEPWTHEEIRLTGVDYLPEWDLVGKNIGLWDPDRNLSDSSAAEVIVGGEAIRPLTRRCVAATWPLRRGMGVYFRDSRYDAAFSWYDLTDWVDWDAEPAAASLEIGDEIRTWGQAARGRYTDWVN